MVGQRFMKIDTIVQKMINKWIILYFDISKIEPKERKSGHQMLNAH